MLQRGGISVDGFTEHVTKDIVQILQGIDHSVRRGRSVVPWAVAKLAASAASGRAMSEIFTLSLICLDDPAGDAAGARGARRTVFRAIGRDQYRARRA